jgi:hypothetical protein
MRILTKRFSSFGLALAAARKDKREGWGWFIIPADPNCFVITDKGKIVAFYEWVPKWILKDSEEL